ncbi:MAG: iron donor protein CyaY [Rhodocyclaceae bacterium]
MDERTFNALADATLDQLEAVVEHCGAEIDVDVKPGGILEFEFRDGSKAVINRHTAAREIWLAARSGGFHFRPDGAHWISARDGEELFRAVSRVISEQAGCCVTLAPPT